MIDGDEAVGSALRVHVWLNASANDTPYLAVALGPCLRVNGVCTGYSIVRGYRVAYVDK